jgi:hypothetical protein
MHSICQTTRVSVPPAPSRLRVLAKSFYWFGAGWAVAVGWLWIAEVQQHIQRRGTPPPAYGMNTAISGVAPALLIALVGFYVAKWTGCAPDNALERQEWSQAFWWSFVPNALLLATVWIMIQEAR